MNDNAVPERDSFLWRTCVLQTLLFSDFPLRTV